MTDKKPHLFTPPTRGTQTVVKDGLNGWQCNTYNGRTWSCLNANNMQQVKETLEKQLLALDPTGQA